MRNVPRAIITKRTCIIVMMLLAGGAIVNVAVAWGLAAFNGPPSNTNPQADDSPWWTDHARGGDSIVATFRYSTRGFDLRVMCGGDPHAITIESSANSIEVSILSTRAAPPAIARGVDLTSIVDSGWPALSVRGEQWEDGHSQRAVVGKLRSGFSAGGENVWAFQFRPPWQANGSVLRLIPLLPLWPGFAINTVFYAVILWGLFAVPLALRKRRRIKRGLCPKCAYDLRGRAPESTVCPECGAAATAGT